MVRMFSALNYYHYSLHIYCVVFVPPPPRGASTLPPSARWQGPSAATAKLLQRAETLLLRGHSPPPDTPAPSCPARGPHQRAAAPYPTRRPCSSEQNVWKREEYRSIGIMLKLKTISSNLHRKISSILFTVNLDNIPHIKITTTKIICRNVSIFFKGGSKFEPLLQIERSYCSTRPVAKNAF